MEGGGNLSERNVPFHIFAHETAFASLGSPIYHLILYSPQFHDDIAHQEKYLCVVSIRDPHYEESFYDWSPSLDSHRPFIQ